MRISGDFPEMGTVDKRGYFLRRLLPAGWNETATKRESWAIENAHRRMYTAIPMRPPERISQAELNLTRGRISSEARASTQVSTS